MNKKTLLLAGILATSLTACLQSQINKSIDAAGSLVEGFTVSKQQLIREARLSAKEMDKKAPIADSSSKYAKRLEKLTKGLHSYDGLKFNYKVYLVNQINAFAMPDGTVRIYSGLMDLMDDDEVVAVIGHEIGHVFNEHSLYQYKKAYVAKAAKEGLTAADGTIGSVAGAYGDVAEDFLNAQFSQSDELESDAYGVKVLYKLGRDPYAAAGAQEKLQALGGTDSVFSSHPPSQKRIDLANEAADKITGKN
jgi:putative metalloprotease